MTFIIKRFRTHIINWLKDNFAPESTVEEVVDYLNAIRGERK